MKLIMNFEVSKGYETWKKAFLANEPMRQRHNINLLAYGHADDNENNVTNSKYVDRINNIKNDKIKKSLLELTKIFKQR